MVRKVRSVRGSVGVSLKRGRGGKDWDWDATIRVREEGWENE